ncbi:GIY-YIG nuclease family protein [Vibrio parahaemolyticus]|nr:GIY-YIG nuclease family protein [Vibrio parahaemolyticus]
MDGYIYILSNKAMPGLLKIGTTTDIEGRLSSLFNTSVPYPFDLLFYSQVMESYRAETEIFNRLNVYRCNDSREFFEIDLGKAKAVVSSVIEEINGLYVDEELDRYYNVWTCPD